MRFCLIAVCLLAALPRAEAESRFRFDATSRRWSLVAPESRLENVPVSLEVDGRVLKPDSAVPTQAGAKLRFTNPRLVWTLRFHHVPGRQVLEIESSIQNQGDRPAKLGRVRLADAASLTVGSDAVALIMSGWQGPSRVYRISGPQPLVSKVLTQVYDPATSTAVNIGFSSFDRAETVIEMNRDESKTVKLSAFCDLAGYSLGPGASIDAETLRVAIGRDPYAGLEQWADRVAERYHPAIPSKLPAGWLGWSWVDPLNVERYGDVVLRNVRAIRRRIPGQDITYAWVSQGNLAGRHPGNWLEWNYDQFPGGPERLVAELGAMNFRLGLWVAPFWMDKRLSSKLESLHDALLLDQGKPLLVKAGGMIGDVYTLDPTHPKTQAFLRDVFTTYRRWGVRYYMIDFVYAITGKTPGLIPNDGYYDRSLIRGPQAWREGWRIIRASAGDDTYLLAATGPNLQAVGLPNGVRTSSDHGEGRPLDPGRYPATFSVNKEAFPPRISTDSLASYYFTNGKLFVADSGNVLTVDQPMPVSDAQIAATIFGINGGPLMLGDDVDRMSEDRLRMIRQLLPLQRETARPVDLFQSVFPDYPKLFHLKISRPWDTWDLVACFNYGDETIHREVDLRQLGLEAGAEYAAWDFWNERYLGVQRNRISFDVPPSSVRLIRLTRERPHPWLLSTDLHIRQGEAEIQDCRWDDASNTLTIRATRPVGESGSLFLHVPKGYMLAKPKGLWIAKAGNDGTLLVRRPMKFTTENQDIRVVFKPYAGNSSHHFRSN